MFVLAGDVGGTNIRLAVFSSEKGLKGCVHEAVFPSRRYQSLREVLEEFFSAIDLQPQAAAFVIAGPVLGDQVEITNLGWVARKQDVRAVLGDFPLGFYNDLAGVSNFVPIAKADDLVVLNPGESIKNRTKAVLAPGTGLGEGFVVWDGTEYRVQPSEGGHASFAPVNEIQEELLAFMRQSYDHVSFERVCSGLAIPHLYQFFKQREDFKEPDWFKQALAEADDQTPVIVNAAFDMERQIPLCEQVLRLFTGVLAAEAGNLALKVLAVGGVYLAGGVTQRILPLLQSSFVEGYIHKGRFSEFLQSIPVYVVTHPQPALFGAAKFAFRLAGVRI
jgi:glucokinase